MTQLVGRSLTLSEFLERPETEPASEYIDGNIIQKPMPQGEHSLLQGELCEAINRVARAEKIARAFPELRCTFGGQALVPDVAVFRWDRIPRTPAGKIANRFEIYPDWVIEILSPEQQMTVLLNKLLHYSQNGTSIGWAIDPKVKTIICIMENQRLASFQGEAQLPVLEGIDLQLTTAEILSWLMI